ncbi:porin [Colwelliaceae bacterium BS250]
MKLNKIASATVAIFAITALPVTAGEIYKDEKSRINFKGDFTTYAVTGDSSGESISEIKDGFNRIYFDFSHQLTNGWSAVAKTEWAVKFAESDSDIAFTANNNIGLGESDDTISNRLGYLGVAHDKWGSITMGKQWGPTYMVTEKTDWFYAYGGDGAGTYHLGDGGHSGVGRAEKSIQYANTIGNLAFKVQVQATNSETFTDVDVNGDGSNLVPVELVMDGSFGAAALYQLPAKFAVGVSHNTAEMEFTSPTQSLEVDDVLTAATVTYGDKSAGLFAALVAVESEYHEYDNNGSLLSDATGHELYVSYRFDNDIELVGGSIGVSSDEDGNDYEKSYVVAGVTYYWSDQFRVFTEVKVDDSTNASGADAADNDSLSVGARFSF